MRRAGALMLCLAAPAYAGTPERDKAWDQVIEAAKAHGGVETKLDQSSSYVFQRDDGSYVTLTRMFKGGKRAACLISKGEDATACFDWDSGKVTYGDRKDAATPWRFHSPKPADPDDEQRGLLASLLSGFGNILASGPKFSCCDRFGIIKFSSH